MQLCVGILQMHLCLSAKNRERRVRLAANEPRCSQSLGTCHPGESKIQLHSSNLQIGSDDLEGEKDPAILQSQ